MDSNYKLRHTALIEDDIKAQFDSLHDYYLQFNKHLDALSSINLMPLNEFKEQKSEYLRRKEEIEKKVEAINASMKALKSADIKSTDLKKRAEKIMIKIKASLPEKVAEFNRMVKSIDGRQHQFSDDSSLRGSIQGDFMIRDYTDSKELSERRQKELEYIKQTSAQVASLSTEMKMHIDKQGETFNALEDNVHNVYLNTHKGGNEIKQMEQVKGNHNKKIAYLIIAIIVLLLFVSYSIYKIIS